MTTIKEFIYEVILPFFLFCVFSFLFFCSLIYSLQYFECRSLAKVYQIETFSTFPTGCYVKTANGPIPIDKYKVKGEEK